MTTFDPTPWEERLRIAVEKTLQQRAVKLAERAQLKRNRDFGLAKRHAKKLYDNAQEKQP